MASYDKITEDENHKVFVDWNNNDEVIEYEQGKCVHKIFEDQVRQNPEVTAISFKGEQVTYEELNAHSNKIAHALIRMGLKLNQPVAIMLEDGPQQIAALLGVLKAGGVLVCLDADYPTNRLSYILEETAPRIIIAESSCTNRHQPLLQQFKQSHCYVLLLDIKDTKAEQIDFCEKCYGSNLPDFCPTTNLDINVSPADPIYIVYTSGSTGKPKGILQSHRSFFQFIEWQSNHFGIRPPKRYYQWASIAYDGGYCQIFGSLCFGGTLCMAPSSVRYNPQSYVEWVREERISFLKVVPSFCSQIIEVIRSERKHHSHNPLPHVEQLILSGEVLPVDLANDWFNLFKNPPPIVNLYGPSECILATYFHVEKVSSDQKSIPIGRAIGGRQILILDKEQKICPIGVRGEIYIRSQYLTKGYFRRPEETKKAFIQNPLQHDYPDPVYRTGDLGRWLADGTIEFCGRMDNQVKLRGIRVELEDIESTLRRHGSIENCVAVVRSGHRRQNKLIAKRREARANTDNSSQQTLVAYYLAKNQVSTTELRNFMEANLPSHMIPQQFIQLEKLPLNTARKVDRKALAELDHLQLQSKEAYVEPRDPMEALIVDIWQDVLGIQRIGINDGFFSLGGDSLLAMQVLNRLRQAINVRLSFRDLFENQTIAELTELVQKRKKEKRQLPLAAEVNSNRKDYPLTLSQQGIWILWQVEPDNPYYTGQGTIHLRGTISLPVLQRAWQALLNRHEILKARFRMEDGKPVQMFSEQLAADLPLIDLRRLAEEQQWHAIEREARSNAKYAFNLEQDHLIKAQLFKLSDNEYQLLLTFHEIILDLWGLSIMIHDLGKLYQGILKGEENPLGPLEVEFSDYALWENKQIQRHKLKSQEAYWEKELSGELPILNLPIDHPRPVSPSYRGAGKSKMLDADLTRKLKILSSKEDTTLFMTLLAAFNILLHVYSGQDDIIIGAPIANRTHEGTEDLVGFFLNMLPLRAHIDDSACFIDFLKEVRKIVTGALTNADYPFIWMIEGTNVVRDLSITPVFQAMFNMQNLPHVSLKFGDLEIAYNQMETGCTKYDLSLYAHEHRDQIFLHLAYLADLFNEDTIDRMLKNLVVIFNSIVENPRLPVSSLNVLNESEKQALLYDFNDTDRDFNNNLCIHQLFEQQAQKTPGQTAFICEEKHLTYEELNQLSNQLAHYLRRRGVGPETIVAICTERSFEMMVGLLAIMKAGGTYVALEPDYPLMRLYDMLDDTKPSLLLIQKHLDRFDEFNGTKIFIDNDWKLIEEEETTNPNCLTTPGNLLNIVYTSSSTGKPKGTLITINNVLNRLFWMWEDYPFRPGDVALLQKSYALVAATWELFGALLKGIPTVILTRQDLTNPEEIWEKVVNYNVSHLLATPAFHEGILIQGELHPGEWRSLRLATTSAEPITPAMVARWKKVFPEVPLLNLYGSTECASNVTVYDASKMPSDAIRTPVGKPLANVRVYILDDNLNPVPVGVTGEMCVIGACVARGYLNLPELNAKQFVPNPFSDKPGSILYKTGDLARYQSDGNIELVGRKDHQVKIRGFRVELRDIEEALLQHEMIEKCVVILDENEVDHRRLVAYIVSNQKTPPAVNEIQHFLRERLPAYMVPAIFIMLDSLPLNPNGKVDRQALPAPDRNRPELKDTYIAPQTEMEKTIATVWKNKLRLEKVGIDDNFFDLGGHSLLLVQVHSKVQEMLERNFPMVKMFEHSTISSLAKCLSEEETNISSLQQNDDRIEKLKEGKSRLEQLLKQRRQGA